MSLKLKISSFNLNKFVTLTIPDKKLTETLDLAQMKLYGLKLVFLYQTFNHVDTDPLIYDYLLESWQRHCRRDEHGFELPASVLKYSLSVL